MKPTPSPETYTRGLAYWPYKASLEQVMRAIHENTPSRGSILDLMCGPGYLLNDIQSLRGHSWLQGVDLDATYIAWAQKTYRGATFEVGDVRTWEPPHKFDTVVCTGALHHIPYEEQALVLKRMASMIRSGGLGIVSDCYIDDYRNETERKQGAARLGYEYLKETIANGAPDDVLADTCGILQNDVMMDEFKTSIAKRTLAFKQAFRNVHTIKVWPEVPSEYGDYITFLRS